MSLVAVAFPEGPARNRATAELGFTEVERFEAYGAEQWFGMRSPVRDRGGSSRT